VLLKTIILVAGAVLGAAAVVGTPSETKAQWAMGPHAGYNIDASEVNLGVTAHISIPGVKIGAVQLVANPGFELYPFMGSGASMVVFNFDLAYPVPAAGPISPYVGAGLMFSRFAASATIPGGTITVSSTDVGLNLKGGVLFSKGKTVRPFAEGTLVVSDATTLVLRGGVQFTVGKP
jgi:hypothetical protein